MVVGVVEKVVSMVEKVVGGCVVEKVVVVGPK